MKVCAIKRFQLIDIVFFVYPILAFICRWFIMNSFISLQSNLLVNIVLDCTGATLAGLPQIVYEIYLKIKQYQFNQMKMRSPANLIDRPQQFTLVDSNDHYWQNKLIALTIVFCMSLLNVLLLFYEQIWINSITKDQKTNNILVFASIIGFLILFYYLILHTKLYIHHYFAIGLIALGSFLFGNKNLGFNYTIISNACVGLIMSVLLTYSKLVMEKKYIHPLVFAFFHGLFALMMIGCVFGISYSFDTGLIRVLVNDFPKSFSALFETWGSIALLLCLEVLFVIINTCSFLIIYNDGPLGEKLLNIILNPFVLVYSLITGLEFTLTTLFALIGSVCIICGNLVYFEVFVCNCCNMTANTKEALIERSEKEVLDADNVIKVIEMEGSITN